MKKHSSRRRFALRIAPIRLSVKQPDKRSSIRVGIPDGIPPPTDVREHESVAALVCAHCEQVRYISQGFLDLLTDVQTASDILEPGLVTRVTPRHVPCQTPMRLILFS